jgi:hypothetical protein
MPADYFRVLGAKIQSAANNEPLHIDIEAYSLSGEHRTQLFAVFTTSDLIPTGATFLCKVETPNDWKDSRYLYEVPDELPF